MYFRYIAFASLSPRLDRFFFLSHFIAMFYSLFSFPNCFHSRLPILAGSAFSPASNYCNSLLLFSLTSNDPQRALAFMPTMFVTFFISLLSCKMIFNKCNCEKMKKNCCFFCVLLLNQEVKSMGRLRFRPENESNYRHASHALQLTAYYALVRLLHVSLSKRPHNWVTRSLDLQT